MDVILPRPTKRKPEKNKLLMFKHSDSVGAELDQLNAEKNIYTDPADNYKRRTLLLHKLNNSWGFTLQTYGIHHKKTGEVEVMTYVDYIDINGAAYFGGMRKGDVIVSVNGENMENVTHADLVKAIKASGDTLRLVVMFEDCCHKVELHDRIIRLKTVLNGKIQELKDLQLQENQIIERYCDSKGICRFDPVRQSIISSISSESWDRYSLVTSPMLHRYPNIPSSSHFRFSQQSDASLEDSGSLVEESLETDDSYHNASFLDSETDSESNFSCSLDSVDSRLNSLNNSSTNVSQSDMVYERQDSGKICKVNRPIFDAGVVKGQKHSPKPLKHLQKTYIFPKAEKEKNIKIPFFYIDSVYINEKDDITKL